MAVSMRSRRRRPWGTIFTLALIAGALVYVLVPVSRGESVPNPIALLQDAFGGEVLAGDGSEDEEQDSGPAEGRVRVLVSGRVIAAYGKVTRDDLWNVGANTWAYTDIDAELAESSGVMTDVRDIVGRVMAHDKSPGYAFSEKDFLPVGTRPGLSAGVPAGKRALRVDVEKVHGIVGLQPGDRFDIVAAQPLDAPKGNQPAFVGLYSAVMQRQTEQATAQRARVRALVQNGVVVSPLQTRQVPVTSTGLTTGMTVKTIPVQEMVIALDPEEVAPFMEALSLAAEITCLARSGHPDDPYDSVTPSSEPVSSPWAAGGGSATAIGGPGLGGGLTVVETIDDTQRVLVPVPVNAAVSASEEPDA